jgi:DNA-binding MarR family transcriptional regulator
MPYDLALTRQCQCLAARKRARAITRHFEAALRPHGLRATQFSVLAVLAVVGPQRMGELARKLGLERTSLTRAAAVLEERGWLRTDRAADARERPLALTAAGRRKLDAAFPAWRAAQEAVPAKFGAVG